MATEHTDRPTMTDTDWWLLRQAIQEDADRERDAIGALIGSGLRAALAYMNGLEEGRALEQRIAGELRGEV